MFHKVNVLGTQAIIAAAVETGVRKLVFTSSAGVVFNGGEVKDVDERIAFPEVPMDAYNDSKAKAETAVLEANGKGGLLTVALRPAGIFGYVLPVKPTTSLTSSHFLRVIMQSWRPPGHGGSAPSVRTRANTLPNR